jgi:hypothetical protein
MLILIEKPGTGIFLIKEKVKLQKQQRNRIPQNPFDV